MNLLSALGLFSITGSLIFRLIAGAIGLNCALRLIDHIQRLCHTPDRPTRPAYDQLVAIDLDTLQAQLPDYRFRPDESWIVGERHHPRSALAVLLVYGGALIVLLGLVLGTLADFRVDNLMVEPGAITSINGTPYALRLDGLNEGRAALALLKDTETIGQGDAADRQPWVGAALTIYLNSTGPALIVSAMNRDGKALGLQNTVDSPAQTEKTISFGPERVDSFLAVTDNNLVLQLTHLPDGRYVAQALQSASGKVLASGDVSLGATFAVNDVTFSFREAAFVNVTAVSQPAHGLILSGWVLMIIGLLGRVLWPSRCLWLQAADQQTRVLSESIPSDVMVLSAKTETDEAQPAHLATEPAPGRRPIVNGLSLGLWLIGTLGLIGLTAVIYPRAALLTSASFEFDGWLSVWLMLSGSLVISSHRAKSWLVIGSLLAASVVLGCVLAG